MPSKGQPAKARRQSQNQRERAARSARTEAAAASEAARAQAAAGDATSTSSGAPSAGGSLLSRLRGGGGSAARPATPRGPSRPAGPVANGTVPGQRAALLALIAAIAAAVVGSLIFPVTLGRDGEPLNTREALVAEWSITALDAVQADPDATPEDAIADVDEWTTGESDPYLIAYFPLSLGVLLPVIGTALGLRAVSRRSSAKVVNRTMYVTLFGTLLNAQLLLVFLPAVIALAVAAFQVRRAEVAAGPAAGASEVDADLDVATPSTAADAEIVDVHESAAPDDDESRR